MIQRQSPSLPLCRQCMKVDNQFIAVNDDNPLKIANQTDIMMCSTFLYKQCQEPITADTALLQQPIPLKYGDHKCLMCHTYFLQEDELVTHIPICQNVGPAPKKVCFL